MVDDPSGRPPAGGVARRRRERRLRAQLRHEQQTVRMVLATVTHHSFQVGTAHDGLRAQKTVTSTREVEERVPHAGLRAQKAPPPGMRPGVLQDPAPQGRVGQRSGIGFELVLALDVPVLQMVEQPVDASALAFLEEIEANQLEVEYMQLVHDGFHKSPALSERMREVMRRRHVLGTSALTHTRRVARPHAAWLALSGASAGGFVSSGSNVGLSTLAFSGVPVLSVCVSYFSRGALHAGVCRFPSAFVDLPGVLQCCWTR